MKFRLTLFLLTITCLLLSATSLVFAEGEEEAEAPKDPVIEALEKEKKIAELKKDIAEAEESARDASLPDTETEGLSGDVTLDDDAGYYAELQAYETLGAAARYINARVANECSDKDIVITDQTNLALKQQTWNLINNRLEWYETEFANILSATEDIDDPGDFGGDESGALALAASLPSMLGGIADIAGFFKTNLSIKNRDIQLAEKALVAEIASHLSKRAVIPELAFQGVGQLVRMLNDLSIERRKVVERREKLRRIAKPSLDELARKRADLRNKEAELTRLRGADTPDASRISALERAISGLSTDIFGLAGIDSEWKKLAAEFDALITAFDQYQKAIAEKSGDKPVPLQDLALVDALKANEGACRLAVSIVSQGSEVHITKSIWTSGRITYLGGSVVTFFLFDDEDKLVASGMVPNWIGESFKAKKGPGG